MQYMARNLDPYLSPATVQYANNTDLYQYAQSIIFNLPPPRVDNYIGTNQDVIKANVVQWASQILYLSSFTPNVGRLIK